MTQSPHACAQLVHRADRDRFLAIMACPPAARRILFALYAFNVEIARIPWITDEPMIAEMRLQFWRDVLDDIAKGAPPRAHDVAVELAHILRPEHAADLDQLVAMRRWDIYKDPFDDQAHFDAYIAATSGNLIWAAARALGAEDAIKPTIHAYGWATGLANFLRAVPALEGKSRIPLVDGRPQAIKVLAARGLAALRTARAARRNVPKPAAYALYPGWQTQRILQMAHKMPARVAQGGLAQSEFRRKITLMALSFSGRW
jgi:phytoene/squalene synthetase